MNIAILNPCHENWDEMTATEKGRFCGACQKQVIDFTQLSDTELLKTLWQNPNTCGRFYRKQLAKNYPVLPPIRVYSPVSKWTKRLLAAAMLLGISTPIIAQSDSSTPIEVKGHIMDKITKQAVPFAEAILFEIQEDGSLIEMAKENTDQKAGYSFALEKDKKYKVVGNAEGYLANAAEFSTENLTISDTSETIILEKNVAITLEVITMGTPHFLHNIYFDQQKYFLREDSFVELEGIVSLLKDNPAITIQIGAHCDVQEAGGNTYLLSETRAKAAVKYFVEKGIEAERLSWKGFGDTEPIFTPTRTEDEKQVNRRMEFRITSIDYQKK